jgi:hypothetical protein
VKLESKMFFSQYNDWRPARYFTPIVAGRGGRSRGGSSPCSPASPAPRGSGPAGFAGALDRPPYTAGFIMRRPGKARPPICMYWLKNGGLKDEGEQHPGTNGEGPECGWRP